MNKKLILFGIITIFLIISIPPVEASLWTDFIDWLSDLFGISKEEATQRANEYITPYSRTIDNGATKTIEIYSAQQYVYEDNKWKTREEARSLKGTDYQCIVQSDNINIAKCLDYNFTSVTLDLSRDSETLTNVPLKKYSMDRNGSKIYSSDIKLNFISKTQKINSIISYNIGEIIEFGEHSTTIHILSNNTAYFKDAQISSQGVEDDLNYGGRTTMEFGINDPQRDRKNAVWYVAVHSFIPSGATINKAFFEGYFTAYSGGTQAINISALGIYWNEGTDNGVANNVSYNYPANNYTTYWGGGTLNIGSNLNATATSVSGTAFTTADWTNYTLNTAVIQSWLDSPNTNYGAMITPLDIGDNNDVSSSEGTNPWHFIVEYTSNTVPSNPVPKLNSTLEAQTNYTDEDLACNFLCSDPDAVDILTYDLYWYRNGIYNISFKSLSCIDPSYNSPILKAGNLSVGQNWSCSVNISDDGFLSSSTVFSNNVTINSLTSIINPSVNLNSTTIDQQNYTNETLSCNFNCQTTASGDTLNYSIDYLENNTKIINSSRNNICLNNRYSIILPHENTTRGYFYSCRVNITSQSESYTTGYYYSNNLTIRNYPILNIQIVIPSQANNTRTANNTNAYNCSADTPDTTLYYEYYQSTANPPGTILANSTGLTTNFTSDGNYWWFCRAVNVYGEYSDNSSIRYLTIDNSTIKSISFVTPSSVYETSINRFNSTVIINKLTSQSLEGKIIYNNNIYTPVKITIADNTTASEYLFSKELTAPSGVTSTNVIWNFTLTYLNGSTTNYAYTISQTINSIELKICNTSDTLPYVNFTFMDEINGTEINGKINKTSMEVTFDYWIGNVTSSATTKSYSYQNLSSNMSQYKFCLNPPDKILTTDMDMEYSSEGYSARTYYFDNATLINESRQIYLYLLQDSVSYKFYIDVKNGLSPLTYATIVITKYNTGTGVYDAVGVRKTDSIGEFIEYLELDKQYKFYITKEGTNYGTVTKQSTCSVSPCKMTLQVEEVEIDLWKGYSDLIAGSVVYTLDYDDITKIVTYTFNDITGLAQYFNLKVTKLKYNESSQTVCDTNSYTTAGTLTCNVTDYGAGDYKAVGFISRSPSKGVGYIFFMVTEIGKTLAKGLGALGILVSLFIIITIALIGYWNPVVGVSLIMLSMFILKVIGFIMFSWTTIILVCIVGGMMIYWMKT